MVSLGLTSVLSPPCLSCKFSLVTNYFILIAVLFVLDASSFKPFNANRTSVNAPRRGNPWDPTNMGPAMKTLYANLQPFFDREPALKSFLQKRTEEFSEPGRMRDFDVKSLLKQFAEYKKDFDYAAAQNASQTQSGANGQEQVANAAAQPTGTGSVNEQSPGKDSSAPEAVPVAEHPPPEGDVCRDGAAGRCGRPIRDQPSSAEHPPTPDADVCQGDACKRGACGPGSACGLTSTPQPAV